MYTDIIIIKRISSVHKVGAQAALHSVHHLIDAETAENFCQQLCHLFINVAGTNIDEEKNKERKKERKKLNEERKKDNNRKKRK